MPRVNPETEINSCPACGNELEQGYLVGKQNRIRWSISAKGMTIFHGVPLIKLEKGFWRRWRWWSYAPSINAVRCRQCRLVFFRYNNDIQENPRTERTVSAIIGGLLVAVAIALVALGVVTLWLGKSGLPIFLLLLVVFIVMLLFLLGIAFLAHAAKSSRPNR